MNWKSLIFAITIISVICCDNSSIEIVNIDGRDIDFNKTVLKEKGFPIANKGTIANQIERAKKFGVPSKIIRQAEELVLKFPEIIIDFNTALFAMGGPEKIMCSANLFREIHSVDPIDTLLRYGYLIKAFDLDEDFLKIYRVDQSKIDSKRRYVVDSLTISDFMFSRFNICEFGARYSNLYDYWRSGNIAQIGNSAIRNRLSDLDLADATSHERLNSSRVISNDYLFPVSPGSLSFDLLEFDEEFQRLDLTFLGSSQVESLLHDDPLFLVISGSLIDYGNGIYNDFYSNSGSHFTWKFTSFGYLDEYERVFPESCEYFQSIPFSNLGGHPTSSQSPLIATSEPCPPFWYPEE